MRLRFSIGILLAAILLSGCTGELEEQVREHEKRVDTLAKQVSQLEKATRALQADLAGIAIEAEPGTPGSESNLVVNVTPDVVASLAEQINERVLARMESTVDQRIASQVGTADDIQAIFSEVVVDEINAREEAERRERARQRLREAAERDTRGVQRRLESMELADERQEQVVAAREAMRDQLDAELAALRNKGAPTEELMAAVAEQRVFYESQLAEILSEEELAAYFGESRWLQRDSGRIQQLNETVDLETWQLDAVADAYAARRSTISDGFYLVRRDYLDRDGMRESFETTSQALQTTMRDVLTDEQYTAYEEAGLSSSGFGHSRR